jgi:hypothetical protein
MKKLFASLIIILFVFFVPFAMADGVYKEEKLLIKGQPWIEVDSARTLVDGSNVNRYSIRNLLDNDKTTVWVTKFDKESPYLDGGLFKLTFKTPVFVRSITIMNGYQRTERLFYANQRVKTLDIEKVLIGGRSFPLENTITLKDRMGAQEVSLRSGWTQSINLFRTKALIFNVLGIYGGSKYQDLCISGITVNYAENIEYTPSVSWKKLRELIDKKSVKKGNGWDWEGLTLNNFRYFNDLLYYALGGNKAANFLFNAYTPEGVAQSEAMTLYKKALEESLAIEGDQRGH